MDRQAQRDIRRNLKRLQFAQNCGNVALTHRRFGVARSSFYRWKAEFGGMTVSEATLACSRV